MQIPSRLSVIFCCWMACFVMAPLTVEAQPIKKSLENVNDFWHDYWLDKPFQYSPCDPFERGKVFRMQTGHWGAFYNCDDEESKRCSPYICWKVHHEKDLPNYRGLFRGMRCELSKVKQRILDGTADCRGDCGEAGCEVCSRKRAAKRCGACGGKGCSDCAGQVCQGNCGDANCQGCGSQVTSATPIDNSSGCVNGNCGTGMRVTVRRCTNKQCTLRNCDGRRCQSCEDRGCAPNPIAIFPRRKDDAGARNCNCIDPLPDEYSPAGLLTGHVDAGYRIPTQVIEQPTIPVEQTVPAEPTPTEPAPSLKLPEMPSQPMQPQASQTQADPPCNCLNCRLKATRQKLATWNDENKPEPSSPNRTASQPKGFRLNRATSESLKR